MNANKQKIDKATKFPQPLTTTWIAEISDRLMKIEHAPPKLSFRFSRHTADLASSIDISGNIDRPEFDSLLNEASQIAEDYAVETREDH